jgi:hypothetical protein
MATRTLTINYADANQARFNAALKTHYGQIEDPPGSGTMRARTTPEAWDAFEKSCKSALRDLVRNVEREAARVAAEASVAETDIT